MSVKSNEKSILSVSCLKKYFKDVHAVENLSFNVKPGEIYGLLGPNGAGKTTTIKNILGLLEPDSGNIDIMGMDPLDNNREIKGLIGYISEEPLIYKSLSPREMFNFISSIRDLDVEETKKMIIDLLDSLEATKYYDSPIITLSKGNKQKIQIISGLIHDPELLIMDEPLAGLDAKSSRVVKDILKIHVSNGGAVLLSTHQMDTAEDLCDRIGIINNGKMVAEGTLEDLRQVAHEAGASLEDVFLKLTDQDESVKNIIEKLKVTLK
ncbi:MAG: ABC transporter ATP-binding protein [archaeon]|nr:ABC transporter ATP-binding protein [archaeon]